MPSLHSALHQALGRPGWGTLKGVLLNNWVFLIHPQGIPRSERLRKLLRPLCPWGHCGRTCLRSAGLKPGLDGGRGPRLAQPVCILTWARSWSNKSTDSIDLSLRILTQPTEGQAGLPSCCMQICPGASALPAPLPPPRAILVLGGEGEQDAYGVMGSGRNLLVWVQGSVWPAP